MPQLWGRKKQRWNSVMQASIQLLKPWYSPFSSCILVSLCHGVPYSSSATTEVNGNCFVHHIPHSCLSAMVVLDLNTAQLALTVGSLLLRKSGFSLFPFWQVDYESWIKCTFYPASALVKEIEGWGNKGESWSNRKLKLESLMQWTFGENFKTCIMIAILP